MVAKPPRMVSTRGKSTAPQITTSAMPNSRNMAPTVREVEPVAQAVMVDVIGPVAPVMMDTFPPTILMQEFALVKGWGSFPSATHSLSARMTASRPPTAELKVMATRGRQGLRNFDPAFFEGTLDNEQGVSENWRCPQGHIPGCQKGILLGIDFRHLAGNSDGKTFRRGETGENADTAFSP